MTLADYMAKKRLQDHHVAKAIGVSRPTILRYRLGQMRPDWDVAQKIARWSKGKVPLESWTGEAA